jgi:tetratricopeptide (TPR) repeat protein
MLHVSQATFVSKPLRIIAAGALALALCGCAGSIERWIVDTRVHQGDAALQRGNVKDASVSYQLALKIDPNDQHARAGFVAAAGLLAHTEYLHGDFDDALGAIDAGLKYDPSSVRLQALKTTIDEAKLQQEIVLSNYPTYRAAGTQIQVAYAQVDVANKEILKALKSFSYTFDTDNLTDAIKRSYELELDVVHNTNRLIAYRQLVTQGVPETTKSATSAGAASLLPLP